METKKSDRIPDMDKEQVRARIESVIFHLVEIRNALAEDDQLVAPPDVSAKVTEKLASRICLFCGKKIPVKDSVSRGCHQRCYQKIRRAIKDGKTTDEMAVWKGQLAERQPGGRKSDFGFDEVNESSDPLTTAIESLEMAIPIDRSTTDDRMKKNR